MVNSNITAQEVIRRRSLGRRMVSAPTEFSGSIDELATKYVLPNLIRPSSVEDFHKQLTSYLTGADPAFLIRALTSTTRGKVYRTKEGGRFKATDNAPAWWIHFALFQEADLPRDSFPSVIETIPTHFFEISAQIPDSVSSAGWHVAHIFAVKDRNTDYENWRRKDLVARCIRNIHPCNYFFLPKTDWQLWGGNERVISFFADLYRNYYRSVWSEFLALSGADFGALANVSGTISYRIPRTVAASPTVNQNTSAAKFVRDDAQPSADVGYSYSRLAFKASFIEPLAPSARFRIVTPEGIFEMTKAEFYSAFPRVVVSDSYRKKGLYHFPSVPKAALRFRISD